jgi:hypothetical protein
MLALLELVGVVAFMIVAGALLCWGVDLLLPPLSPPRRRRRKRTTCPAKYAEGKAR